MRLVYKNHNLSNTRQVPVLWEPVLSCGQTAPVLKYPSLEQFDFISHCFSTREGGVSAGEFATMNFSFARGDDPDAVVENYRRIAEVIGCKSNQIVASHQTHTTHVRLVTTEDTGKGVTRERDYSDVDGLITNEPGICLATFFADCVPLYFVDPVHKAIGLSHSGWRGTVARMGQATLDKMAEAYGTNPADVFCAIGPSICQDCYEVSLEVAERFTQEFFKLSVDDYLSQETKGESLIYESKSVGGERKFRLNLWYANMCVLTGAGVPKEQIEMTELCTCCNSNYLFSHRASHGRRGNLGAFLMMKQ